MQKEAMKKSDYFVFAVYDDALVGVITLWSLKGITFIENFAIAKEKRNFINRIKYFITK